MGCFGGCLGDGGGEQSGGGRRGGKAKKKSGNTKNLKLVLVGLDGAGKSTLLQTILGGAPEKTMPTFGFTNASTTRGGFDVDLFDLGGGKRIRGIWKAYTADVHGCIFVVDSAAEDRLHECREVFAETLRDPHLSGKPIVVFANKQDLPGAKSAAAIAEGLGLTTLQNARHHIVTCTALRGGADDPPDTQVDLGMRWMLEQVGQDWDVLNPRVRLESEVARAREEKLKKERVKRGEEARRERLEQEEQEERAKMANERNKGARSTPDTGNAIKSKGASPTLAQLPEASPAASPRTSGPDVVMAMRALSSSSAHSFSGRRRSPRASRGSPPPPVRSNSSDEDDEDDGDDGAGPTPYTLHPKT
jgi:small GTP-binding protein